MFFSSTNLSLRVFSSIGKHCLKQIKPNHHLPIFSYKFAYCNFGQFSTQSKDKMKIIVFLGSVRDGRMGERVAKYAVNAIKEKGMEPILFDPLEMPFELLKLPLHFMPDPTKAPEWLQEANETIKTADGFLIVSSEYNSTIPPALTNMLDHFSPSSYKHRPAGVITYSMGSWGGMRAQSAIRPFLSELGMISVPAYTAIGTVQNTFDEEGKCNAGNERITAGINKIISEIEWYGRAINEFKAKNPPPT